MKKEGFVIYKSFYKPISRLSDKQLGRLFRAIFLYQLGEVVTVEEDIEMAFEFFKNQFEIDESKYQGIVEGNRNNGRKGGAPKGNSNAKKEKQAEQPKTTETTENKRSVVFQAKQAYKEKDKEKDKEKEKDNNNPPLSPNGDIPPGEPPAAVDDGNEGQQTPPSPPPEREKSSAKKEKELVARIVAYYHERCPSLPRVKTITTSRVSAVMARIREHGKEAVAEMINHAGMSAFLAGDNNRGWTANFDWIFKPTNFVKVYEGKFDNKLPPVGQPVTGGRPHAPGRTDADHKKAERDSLNEMALAILHDAAPQDHL